MQIVSFNCILKNKLGATLCSTFNREVIIGHPDPTGHLPGLAKGLQNLSPGEKRTIELDAANAYGFYDPKKVILFPLKKLSKQILTPGKYISILTKSGVSRDYKVIQIHDQMISLDGNHPLAGQDLIFEIDTIEARSATDDEIKDLINPLEIQRLH